MLFSSFAAGALVGIALVIGHQRGMRSRLPFGPFLAIGGGFALLLVVWLH
jgi:prepilin signal peptidase PulO-like enzyme (type II secretory pathway)